ncbi:Acetyltransferase (GNAT) family protein [Cognatiyoonia koreensis]|uniref:Acetyltransferase (GNAT) family protein n=2 Tax=Paracoccaceae TaxID=31989 RepID=A0A1I0PUV3_9RHOB|nr:GNAT family N-acetyltransferase [Cognatiyoonia koreensis]SEW18238.1 Acetyltransferase (GNAT) family protein [Cognatiyoonia koreensis]
MTQIRSSLSVALAPPLRPFKPEDADTVARLNDMASGGMLLTVWKRMAGTNGDPWEQGRHQQFEQIESGWNIVVLDQGSGVEAVMMGQPHGAEPASLEGVDAEWVPLMELENLVPEAWCLNVIATLPAYRGLGHGARLMAQAQSMARAGGHSRIALVVSDASIPAIRLYERSGFEEIARRPMFKGDWKGPGQDWVLMVKSL